MKKDDILSKIHEVWDVESIQQKVSNDEALAQLAEEASELIHSALKLRRSMSDNNPTPVSYEVALSNFVEEAADVEACFDVLFDRTLRKEIQKIKQMKLKRWVERISKI